MKKQLLEVIFDSEKRKNTLLLLYDGPQEMDFILKSLDTTRQALLPQMKVLEQHYLITHYDDTYELTTIGKMIVDEMYPLLNIIEVFDSDIKYWGSHDLGFIPSHLFNRLRELAPCKVISDMPPSEMYEPSKTVVEKAKRSKVQTSVTTFLFPNFASILADFNKNGVRMRLIVSEDLLSRIRNDMRDVRDLLNSEFHEVFLYTKEMDFASFGANDSCFIMRTFTKSGDYDPKYVMACNPSAIQWANELFDYYLKNSTPINKI